MSDAAEDICRPPGGADRTDVRNRTCIVTRTVQPDHALLRFVAGPDGEVVPDLKARLPGRGVWVSLSRQAVALAVRRRLFRRGLKADVAAADDLPDQVETLLRQAALGRLGLARKAGSAVAGFAKVQAAIAKGAVCAVLAASDGAADGRRKIAAAVARDGRTGPRPDLIETFTASELGLALGQSNVIHAAVLHGAAGRGFVNAAARLHRYGQNVEFENKRTHRSDGADVGTNE